MPQIQKSLLQALRDADQGGFYFLHWLAVVIDAKLNFKLFSHQKQMLLDFKQELIYDSIHILHNWLSADILLHFSCILIVQAPIRMDFRNVFKFMIQVVIV